MSTEVADSSRGVRVAVCIGRFQPPTVRHLDLIEGMLVAFDYVYVVCTGAAQPVDPANPWTIEARTTMLRACLPDAKSRVLAVADCWYDDARWAARVEALVAQACVADRLPPRSIERCCLGLERAGPDYYARLFPDWQALAPPAAAPPFEPEFGATLLGADPAARAGLIAAQVPAAARPLVDALWHSPQGAALAAEQAFILDYRRRWEAAPFPPVFVTVDTLVVWRAQVLLVRRGRLPGVGLLALPGGFLDPGESLAEAARRELAEETGLALADAPLAQAVRVFDHPLRSRRGRTITHVWHFDLSARPAPPRVAGGDDAADARWMPLAALDPRDFFEDHYAILQTMLGLD